MNPGKRPKVYEGFPTATYVLVDLSSDRMAKTTADVGQGHILTRFVLNSHDKGVFLSIDNLCHHSIVSLALAEEMERKSVRRRGFSTRHSASA